MKDGRARLHWDSPVHLASPDGRWRLELRPSAEAGRAYLRNASGGEAKPLFTVDRDAQLRWGRAGGQDPLLLEDEYASNEHRLKLFRLGRAQPEAETLAINALIDQE
ncbi:MAG: hypothetical protein QM767_22760 [Anaeromyxobacter sp.]